MDEEKKIIAGNDLIGDMLKQSGETSGLQHLKGAGKPLPKNYFSGDTFAHFQRIAKDAGYKPHWLHLQHEIRREIEALLTGQPGCKEAIDERIRQLNEKIKEHNKHCPPPLLKGSVSADRLKEAWNRWK